MPFEKIFTLRNELPIPGRLYVHSAGLDIFGEGDSSLTHVRDYALKIIGLHRLRLEGYSHFLAAGWGDDVLNQRVLDIFRYRLDNGVWHSNAWVSFAVIREKIWSDELFSCEDSTIMVGKEGELRKNSRDLDDYFAKQPLGIPGIRELC